jgi:hypothetical protein
MCDFMNRCAGRKVDKGALGANAQFKNDFWAQCIECTEEYRRFGARAQRTHPWVKKPVHLLLHGREENFG